MFQTGDCRGLEDPAVMHREESAFSVGSPPGPLVAGSMTPGFSWRQPARDLLHPAVWRSWPPGLEPGRIDPQTTAVRATSSVVELTAALRSTEISSRDLLESDLDGIERLDRGGANAVVTLDVDRARGSARVAAYRQVRRAIRGYEVRTGF